MGAQILQDMGFDNVTYMDGGMTAWKEAAVQLEQENSKLLALNNVRIDPALTSVTGIVLVDSGSAFRQSVLLNVGARDGIVEGARPATQAEQDSWRQRLRENVSAGTTEWHDSAGESKLPPQSVTIPLYRERTYIVLRARVRARLGWGNPTPGMTKLLCTHTGEEVYVKRTLLEKVE